MMGSPAKRVESRTIETSGHVKDCALDRVSIALEVSIEWFARIFWTPVHATNITSDFTPGIAAHATMLRRSLSTLAGVASRAQAARAGCVANLNAPSYFSTVASSGLDQREKSDRLQHSRLAVAAAWRGEKCARLDESFEVMAHRRAQKTA